MLALTREPGQKIVIGGGISIVVLSVSQNGRVRLGIEAPADVRIDREEVIQKIKQENMNAAQVATDTDEAAEWLSRINRNPNKGTS